MILNPSLPVLIFLFFSTQVKLKKIVWFSTTLMDRTVAVVMVFGVVAVEVIV